MAKKPAGAKTSGGASVPASRSPVATMAREDARPTNLKPSSLLNTRVIYCGDCLEQLKRFLVWYPTVVLTVFCCGLIGSAEAQQKIAVVQREEDIIANSVVQPVAGTNKVIVAGPIVPLGTPKRPITYTIRAEIDGEKITTALIVAFDAADEYRVFATVVNEEGKKIPINPSIQQEIQGRKDTAYLVKLSDEYIQKASKAGIAWSFQGTKEKAKIKVPNFFFTGFMKKVAATKAALKPSVSDKME